MELQQLIQTRRSIRVIGVDDAHYADKTHGSTVNVAGIVCGGTRFEGMLWGSLKKDGMDATENITTLISQSKFHEQLHLVLLDGITFGGCNIADLPAMHESLQVPVVAVMRRPPNMPKFKHVVDSLPERDERWRRTLAAGEIHEIDGWTFQCVGEKPSVIAKTLTRLTDRGKVPEALRLAHLIGSAIKLGTSSNRA